MLTRAFKYYSPLIIFILAGVSFTQRGWLTFLPLFYAFGLIPLLELWLKPDPSNMSEAEEALARKDLFYDFILYLIVIAQVGFLLFFLQGMRQEDLSVWERAGRILTMGILCGAFGINVGHELGHRTHPFEQFLAKVALSTSLYMHFFIEHNKGHHKRVATPDDPSSARYGESLYRFWMRSVVYSYIGAWKIANRESRKKGRSAFSLYNEMLQFQVIQLGIILCIDRIYGHEVLLCFLGAAGLGILMLETVNYIEHYGLVRRKIDHDKYERALPQHSWNSDHIIGRLMLFELSRHSDHHYLASRKYQILRHHPESPQMPTGYPGMIILSFIPPLWFQVLHKRIQQLGYSESTA